MERQRKPRVNLIGYKNSHGIVEELGPPGKFQIRCEYCGELHTQSSREIQRDSRPFKCKNFKPHNWSGLDRWDAIIRREYGITLEEYYKLISFYALSISYKIIRKNITAIKMTWFTNDKSTQILMHN